MFYFILLLVNIQYSFGALWPKGVIHYVINTKDYDVHSQDIIITTFSEIQREICVKFFYTPQNYTPTADAKILFITNPTKRKDCHLDNFDYNGTVVEVAIGYKCLNKEDITKTVVALLRAGIKQNSAPINSYDLKKTFEDLERSKSPSGRRGRSLLSPADRNYINAYYHAECDALTQRRLFDTRRSEGPGVLTDRNIHYYEDKLWPLGIVMYQIEEGLSSSSMYTQLRLVMSKIEQASCIVFQEIKDDDVLAPKSLLYFTFKGDEAPRFGFVQENQTVSISTMMHGAPGHVAHTINLLFRTLGIPMMSNRYDRDLYVTVHWDKVIKGMEHYLEREPADAWVNDARFPYDFESVSHAPANYMCDHCEDGDTTVTPVQDYLWQKQIAMGHHTELSEGDKELIKVLYEKQCQQRFIRENRN